MLKNGYLQESDLTGSSYSQIANGNIVENSTVNLRELEIGGLKLNNVKAVIIHELSAPLLLGQSAIEKLGKIQLENDELIIMISTSPSPENNCIDAKKLANSANKYYFDNLNTLAAETYQKAFDLCAEAIDCFNLELMGSAYYYSEKYQLAIKYLEKAAICTDDPESLYSIFHSIGNSYKKIGDYYNAILNLEKCFLYTTDNNDISLTYFGIAWIKCEQTKYDDAIKYYEQSVAYRLKIISKTMDDVMRGEVTDQVLGEALWNTKVCYIKNNSYVDSDVFAAASALCGYQEAIGYCERYEIKYKNFVHK
jgi:tetratricopeptide (TPR) repeat protein